MQLRKNLQGWLSARRPASQCLASDGDNAYRAQYSRMHQVNWVQYLHAQI